MGTASSSRNWFDQGGQAYANFRPEYPTELARHLLALAPERGLVVDVGCGNGQFTVQLAQHVHEVLGVDPSADQLLHAVAHPQVRYVQASAEQLPVAAGSARLITAAQAVHWFDVPRFYDEVRRVAVPDAVLALISYGVLELESAALADCFASFYHQGIGRFWPAQRKLVDEGYAALPFPFDEVAGPGLSIEQHWTLDQLLGYIATWSAVRQAREAGRGDVLAQFAQELCALWGPREQRQSLRWPLNMRLGKVSNMRQP